MMTTQSSTHWIRREDKLFEEALVMFPEASPNRWQNIADRVPGKSAREVRDHYETLVHDVYEIEFDRVEIPSYSDGSTELQRDSVNQISFGSERKKGTPWTEQEHKLFLIGLSKFGKGDWRSISRKVVVTRTPTQVASHAQKYFLRQNSGKKERKRSSIHDITTVDTNTVAMPVDQNWIPSPGGQAQQPPAYQQLHPSSHLPNNQGASLGFQNFGFPL